MIAWRWRATPSPCRRLRLGFGLGLLHLENLVGLAAGLGRDLLALRGVDVVHGGLHLGVGNDVGDQRAQNVVAEGVHHLVEISLDGAGDLLHLLEGFVESERGHVAEDGVEDVALDLALRIRSACSRRRRPSPRPPGTAPRREW